MFKCPINSCGIERGTYLSLSAHLAKIHRTSYPEVTGMKWCGKCRELKTISNFYKTHDKNVRKHYCIDCSKIANKKERTDLKKDILDHYGHRCNCSGCDVVIDEWLTVDHVNNDGAKHRTNAGYRYTGKSLYGYIKRNNYPDTFQILCWNCNCSRYFFKVCPHKLNKFEDSMERIFNTISK